MALISESTVLTKDLNYWCSRECKAKKSRTPYRSINIKTVFPGIRVSIMKIKRSWDRLIFIMGISLLVRRHIYIETIPRWLGSKKLGWFVAAGKTANRQEWNDYIYMTSRERLWCQCYQTTSNYQPQIERSHFIFDHRVNDLWTAILTRIIPITTIGLW